jgi:hypothetical protein
MITPEDLKALLKKHRWSIAVGKSGRQQVYSAKQRRGKRLATCYIGTSNKLNILTEDDIVAKLNRSAMRLVNERGSHDQAHTDQSGPNRAHSPALDIIPATN